MKQYVIDELRSPDFDSLSAYFQKQYGPTAVDGIFWIPVASDLLRDIQKTHHQCQPHYFAVELDKNRMALELLVRSKSSLRCDCIGYASESQRNWIIAVIDDLFNQLEIMT